MVVLASADFVGSYLAGIFIILDEDKPSSNASLWPPTDYMAMLEDDEAACKRQAFVAENRFYCLTDSRGDKLGLWHPYLHDLRSRGTAIAQYDPTNGSPKAGIGNDYRGWEWYRGVNVAVGSVVDDAGSILPSTGEKLK